MKDKKVDRVEISGAAMRMKLLQQVVASRAFPDSPDKQCSGTLNLDESVSRGACLLGELVYQEKVMTVSMTTVPFEYSNGKEDVKHSLRILGFGEEMEGDENARVKVICTSELKEAASEHACERGEEA